MTSSDRTATRAGGRHGRPWRAAGTAVVVLLGMVGAGLIGASVRTVPPPRPPQPLAQAGTADTAPSRAIPGPTGSGTQTADQAPVDDAATPVPGLAPTGLPRSAPTTISIPRIGVNAEIMSLGLNADGSVQVPPLEQAMKAGWYSLGASPGEVGNAVIVGHVDSAKLGPAVFFNLGALKAGDTISVARQDGSTATFAVNEVKSYPKTAFPTEVVYGPSDKPSLRVVTCGGQFDQSSGSYLNNVIAFATMIS
ncbi:class F sortase [Micromonospora sp. DR5-3]|uniref:class F sortase n=1 Tax=unclassified Micromonospora TaxID=2617518 RepID=UPI0011D97D47|nr:MULTISPECIES: class F sortase [unclassified Micromonospora]MCW3815574.1 class F sortase [Micromonospora sp. DR5-3]TYC21458.1 class F sortase [Micromonospora sp. MP36]